MFEQTDVRRVPRCRSRRSALAHALTGCGVVAAAAIPGVATAGAALEVRVGVVGVNDVTDVSACCTAPPARFDGAALATVAVGPHSSPQWLRIDAPLAGAVLTIRPVVDRATLYCATVRADAGRPRSPATT